uniref:Formylglycine-generating enzyme, required for sulfatase activity, contains SUMF1/FGE domain n=1 Tax=Candidatus Kentrum sp. TC TaxID=2126339 RepID=A0A450ZTX6_9GAMM|nr:MAG: Formylglycine-generating enzyme, required for sulfatase activity, contains SUMF1/FGE domain [Candidatus Kentron sp. TC]
MKRSLQWVPIFGIAALAAMITALAIDGGFARENRGGRPLSIRTAAGEQVGLYRESHALVIGVSDYDSWPKLPGARQDVEVVARALRANGFQVETLQDPDSDRLKRAFEQFIARRGGKPDNRLLFYFAGHGHTVKPKWGGDPMGYIAPKDAPNPNRDPAGFEAMALPMQRIEEYALKIHAKHALFLFDSCFSGALFNIARSAPENISYKTALPVRQFITAGDAGETVPDRSIFRRQFIAALSGEGDADGDGFVTGAELGEFLQKQVINYSKGDQHPQYGKIRNSHLDKGDFVFEVGKSKKGVGGNQGATGDERGKPSANLAVEREFWNSIKNNKDPEEYRAYLERYPRGAFAGLARIRIRKFTPPTPEQAVAQPAQPKMGRLIAHSNVSGDTVFIDGKSVGPTGPDAHALAPGEYEIRVEKAGFEPFETRIALSAGDEKTIRARLERSVPVRLVPVRDRLRDGSSGPEMARIEGGCFRMGSPPSEKGRDDDERQHRVCVEGFYMGKYEATFAEYDRFAKAAGRKLPKDRGWGRGKRPVINVNWEDATAYAGWLSRETGKKYRLPTEAEWEFAARAGTTTRYYWGNDFEDELACDFANSADLTAKEKNSDWITNNCRDGFVNTAPVGSFRTNGYGLFDMSGNVWEWTCSLYQKNYDGNEKRCVSKGTDGPRVARGGGWNSTPWSIRSAYRFGYISYDADDFLGFRLAREF